MPKAMPAYCACLYSTPPPLRNFRDNAKLACHGPVCYEMEWIYTQTKMRGQDSLELALEMKKKEIGFFLNISF